MLPSEQRVTFFMDLKVLGYCMLTDISVTGFPPSRYTVYQLSQLVEDFLWYSRSTFVHKVIINSCLGETMGADVMPDYRRIVPRPTSCCFSLPSLLIKK